MELVPFRERPDRRSPVIPDFFARKDICLFVHHHLLDRFDKVVDLITCGAVAGSLHGVGVKDARARTRFCLSEVSRKPNHNANI